jgi:GNAT superfamily N-acetyltransferase
MIELGPGEMASLTGWFEPEEPGWMTIGSHVRDTGHGRCWVDRKPDPRVVLVQAGDNYLLVGDPGALTPESLPRLDGFVGASPDFLPVLQAAVDRVGVWDRVTYLLRDAPRARTPEGFDVRRLVPDDAPCLAALDSNMAWIGDTWGGAAGLATSGHAWAAFDGDALVSVACTFFLGRVYEEIAVVTEQAYRGRGLSTACAGRLCEDVRERRHVPSWSTSPDNVGSIRVAEKIGFEFAGEALLYAVEVEVPS